MNIKKGLIFSFCIFLMTYAVNVHAFSDKELKTFDLDKLFNLLKHEENENQARKLENQIWLSWLSAENDEIDGLINDAFHFRREFNLTLAIKILDEIIEKVPHYAEAWNQRAIAYFYKGDLDLAIKNIEKTLELEPRHFGAMAGRAVIHLKLTEKELAKASIAKALTIHPFLPERTLFPELYEKPKT